MPHSEDSPGRADKSEEERRPELSVSPFDKHAEEFDAWFDAGGEPVFQTELEALKQVLPTLHKPWLEIGVGTGRFAQALGIETGLDISPDMLKFAARRNMNVALARGGQLPFHSDCFNTVFLITTLCFLEWPLLVLLEAHRVLKSGGKIVLADMPGQSPWTQLYEQMKQQEHPVYKYAVFYNYRNLVSLVEQSGFFVQDTVSTLLQSPDAVSQVEEPHTGFVAGSGFVVIVANKR